MTCEFRVAGLALTGLLCLAAPAAMAGETATTEGPAEAAEAAITPEADGARRINVADRQRMLGQRVAKAACMVALGVEPGAHREQIRAAIELFDLNMDALRFGDPDAGLLPEGQMDVKAALGQAGRHWQEFRAAVEAALAGESVNGDVLEPVAALSLPLLAELDATVALIEQSSGMRHVALHKAIAISVAGRQRMLSQKMAKEACLLAEGVAAEDSRAALAQSVETFDLALAALRLGMAEVGIRPPGGEALAGKLGEAARLWSELKPLYEAMLAGGEVEAEAVATVAGRTEPLLDVLDEAVFLYEREG